MSNQSQSGKELAPYLEPLTAMQRIFVKCRLEGMSPTAAAVAAGSTSKNVSQFTKSKAVQEALRKGMEAFSSEVMFSRRKAHDMYLDAHRNAANTTEQVMAINAMVKLHGIAAPEVKQIEHSHKGAIEHREVRELTDEDLLSLAKLPTDQIPEVIEGEYQEILRDNQEEDTKKESDG